MKVDELIEILQEAKKEHGNIEIALFNAGSYFYEPITKVKKAEVKTHPTCKCLACNSNRVWMEEAQAIFDKNPVREILYLD